MFIADNGDQVLPAEAEQAYNDYVYVRDAIIETMDDADDWDGDAAEPYILAQYVKWLAAGKPEQRPAL
jgi:hypothetical protein